MGMHFLVHTAALFLQVLESAHCLTIILFWQCHTLCFWEHCVGIPQSMHCWCRPAPVSGGDYLFFSLFLYGNTNMKQVCLASSLSEPRFYAWKASVWYLGTPGLRHVQVMFFLNKPRPSALGNLRLLTLDHLSRTQRALQSLSLEGL